MRAISESPKAPAIARSPQALLVVSLVCLLVSLPFTAGASAHTPSAASMHHKLRNARTNLPAGAVPMRSRAASTATGFRAAASSPRLKYYGGPVVSNVSVQSVLWGSSGQYLPQETGTSSQSFDTFLTQITNSAYVTRLREYDTPGANGQSIGAGSFAGRHVITPSKSASGTTLKDSTVRSELLSQIKAGHLPSPSVDADGGANTVYTLFFPEGVQVCTQGACSGVEICAYHGSFAATIDGHALHVRYLALPYPSAEIVNGCKSAVAHTPLRVEQSLTSHELTEAITDPDVSLANGLAPPLGWYDSTYGEIADICVGVAGTDATLTGSNGHRYVAQKTWSNALDGCTVTGATASRDAIAPRIAASRPSRLFGTRRRIVATYRATDAGSGVAGYDVQYRRAPWNGSFGSFTTLARGTHATSVSLVGRPGNEYCLRERAHDRAGNVSAWTRQRCAAVPLDDRSLRRTTSGWRHTASARSYLGTLTTTRRALSTVRLRHARTDHFAVVATTCPRCGKVAVYLNGVRWQVLNTHSAVRHTRVVLTLPRTRLRTVTVALRTISPGRLVLLDAIGFSRT